MKIYFLVQPVSRRYHGWHRVTRLLEHYLNATLVLEMATCPRH